MCSIRWCKFLTRDLSLLYCNSAGRNCLLFVQEVPALYSCYWELGYSRIVITKHIANALGMTPSRTKLKAYQRLSHVTRVTHTTTTFPFIFLSFQHHLHIQFPSCPFLPFLRSNIIRSYILFVLALSYPHHSSWLWCPRPVLLRAVEVVVRSVVVVRVFLATMATR
jgi:hypothetical protein